jgi:cell division protein FtsI (penicillin-binding protein 3)
VAFLFVVVFLVVILRSGQLQLLDAGEWGKRADRQHLHAVPLVPERGTIHDRNGTSLAVSIERDSCFADPRLVTDKSGTAARLAPILAVPRETISDRLRSGKGFVWLRRQLTPETAERVRALRLPGIGFVKESRRSYPNSALAAHLIGFTGLDPEGLEGVEYRYDSYLLGSSGYIVTERDALGRDVGLTAVTVRQGARGHELTLTLDATIQYLVEKELAKGVAASGATGGEAIVLEPESGKILAMAVCPSFNPNDIRGYGQNQLRNRAVADSFEPGSTMKVLLLGAALEEGTIKPQERINCERGNFAVGGTVIHDDHPYSSLTVAEVLRYSSNIGAAKIGMRLGKERLYSYLRAFGLGERSGIDLPGEATGSLRDRSQWYGSDLATISFGQGVTVTPLQLTAAIAAIGNGGVLMRPYVVERINALDGTLVKQVMPEPRRRVVSPETAHTLLRLMEGVVAPGGTGTAATVAGFRVAGKTGTSQKVDRVTRSYSVDKRTASFVGLVPAEAPRLTIMVVIDEPKSSPYGGVVAAPVFSAIATQTLAYLKVPPSGAQEMVAEVAEPVAAPLSAPPLAGDAAAAGGGIMPDCRGMSMRQLLALTSKQGIAVRIVGTGRVVEQSPAPGSRIRPTDPVWVRFASGG